VLQTGLKIRDEHRRWTEAEIDALREHIATHTVEETAKMLGRSAKSVRCALHRYDLKIREIRCDWMSIHSLANILHVRKAEIQSWIEKGWLEATIYTHGMGLASNLGPLVAVNSGPSVAARRTR
jgi:DNA-binding transcriptional regulator YiaG